VEDEKIIELFFARSEEAISQTKAKYGRLIRSVSYGILKSHEDSEECEQDTYLKAWNKIPPTKPSVLSAFLSRIARNLSLDMYDRMHADKRGGSEVPVLLDELSECIPSADTDAGRLADENDLKRILDSFLSTLKPDSRKIFMRRYFYADSVEDIADNFGFGVSKVKMSLSRSRKALADRLTKEGYTL